MKNLTEFGQRMKQLQNAMESVQSKRFFMKQSCNCYRRVTTGLLNIIAETINKGI